MQPIEIDAAVGIHGERAVWHRELLAHVDPQHFISALQDWVGDYLAEAERQVTAARASVRSEVATTSTTGSVVSEGEGVAARSRAATPEPKKPRRKSPAAPLDDEPTTTGERWERMEQRRKERIEAHLKQRGVEVA